MGGAHGVSEPKRDAVGVGFIRFDKGNGPLNGVDASVIGRCAGFEARRIYGIHLMVSFLQIAFEPIKRIFEKCNKLYLFHNKLKSTVGCYG